MYNHNKAQQSKNHVHISWDILYVFIKQGEKNGKFACYVIALPSIVCILNRLQRQSKHNAHTCYVSACFDKNAETWTKWATFYKKIKCIYYVDVLIHISLKCFLLGEIIRMSALLHIMAWHQRYDKPLSEKSRYLVRWRIYASPGHKESNAINVNILIFSL